MDKHDAIILTSLPVFMAVAEALSFTRASAKLHLTVSAVSQTIKRLEQNMACSLFLRQGNRVLLTREGSILQKHAERIFVTLDEGLREVGCREQRLRIFAPPGVSSFLFSQKWLGELSQHVASIEMVADEKTFSGHLEQWDMAILLDDSPRQREALISLGNDAYFPFCHPSLAEKIHHVQDLFKFPLFFNQHGLASWDAFFSLNHLSPPALRKIVYSRASQLISAVESAEGIGFESSRVLAEKIKQGAFVLCPLPHLKPVVKQVMWLYLNPDSPIHRYQPEIKERIINQMVGAEPVNVKLQQPG